VADKEMALVRMAMAAERDRRFQDQTRNSCIN
jgi:hypothetical protein